MKPREKAKKKEGGEGENMSLWRHLELLGPISLEAKVKSRFLTDTPNKKKLLYIMSHFKVNFLSLVTERVLPGSILNSQACFEVYIK